MGEHRMGSEERVAFMWLRTLTDSMDRYLPKIKSRLLENRYTIRNLKTARTHVRKALDILKKSMAPDELLYVEKNCADYETVIRPRTISPDALFMYIKIKDAEKIATVAVHSECELCVCDRQQQATCELRKSLKNLIDEPKSKFGCGFVGGIKEEKK